jgi:hypothetical protein
MDRTLPLHLSRIRTPKHYGCHLIETLWMQVENSLNTLQRSKHEEKHNEKNPKFQEY